MTKVLAIGGGGREHAAVDALHRSGAQVFAVMKNRNPGISSLAEKVLLADEKDIERICAFARENGVELAFVGPEAPLEAGIVDALEAMGVPCASPTKAAARIETSKTFMRQLVQDHGIGGNLGFAAFSDAESAKAYAEDAPYQLVVKPVGLTGGKGVKVEGEHLLSYADTCTYI
ncbi:MAG: phosphoribosylamine--glycine ligase, partial [Candidatus Methanomethylophilaceae archaeon]|nr:phosphoribosylamine--glycine ligase [Candidatus Methanomethylophilaceae archaeon]